MYVLYGCNGSGSAAIEAALGLAGARWTLVKAASWEPDSGFDALLRINPLGLVPTLVLPDGSVLTESAAILMHLGEAHPASGLLPAADASGRRPRPQAVRGLVFIAAHCYAAIGIIDYPERWCTPCDEATAERIRAGTRARLHRSWEVFADTFFAGPRVPDEAPDALDLLAAVVSRWSGARAHLARARPAFLDTLERIERHPRVAAVFARHWPPSS
jgi:GST-like protein